MRIITHAVLFAAVCQAQIAFVPTRPGNWTPTKPLFGVLYGSDGDTINYRSIKNAGTAPIVIQAVSLEIKSPGLEGEWWGNVYVEGVGTAELMVQRAQFLKFRYLQVNSPFIAPNSGAKLTVSGLTDCYRNDYLSCAVDRSVTPPDSLFKHNTANPVDTIDARLGVYWRVQGTDTNDSAYLDCRIEYRSRAYTVGSIRTRSSFADAARPVGVSGGWRVESGAWSLRRPDGAVVPLEHQATAQGLLLQPTLAFAGVGILHNAEGQAFRVVGTR